MQYTISYKDNRTSQKESFHITTTNGLPKIKSHIAWQKLHMKTMGLKATNLVDKIIIRIQGVNRRARVITSTGDCSRAGMGIIPSLRVVVGSGASLTLTAQERG